VCGTYCTPPHKRFHQRTGPGATRYVAPGNIVKTLVDLLERIKEGRVITSASVEQAGRCGMLNEFKSG